MTAENKAPEANGKPKLAIYWGASCGGCEIAILGLHERILDVLAALDLVFCPCVMDGKLEDVEAMADGAILVTLFNGSVRNSEQEFMARLLRRKSQIMIAFGSCAIGGCIPGLANATTRKAIFDTAYETTPSTENPDNVRPEESVVVDGCELTLPRFYDRVHPLDEIVDVDFYLPGCPPEAERIWEAVNALLTGNVPEKGSVIGRASTVCDECARTRAEKRITKLVRTWQIKPDEDTCLLEQGLVCAGIATRAGCEALCPAVNAPCIGCYGAPDGVEDFGARLMSGIASVIDSDDPDEVQRIIDEGIPDPVGTFYRFGLAKSLLGGRS